jgi:hypothetical protein
MSSLPQVPPLTSTTKYHKVPQKSTTKYHKKVPQSTTKCDKLSIDSIGSLPQYSPPQVSHPEYLETARAAMMKKFENQVKLTQQLFDDQKKEFWDRVKYKEAEEEYKRESKPRN